MTPFITGKTYLREEIHAQYGGQSRGGISTPAAYPMIFLFTGEQGLQYGYADRFQDDGTFWYTGEGQVGDMQMIRGNLAIYNHRDSGKVLHLFHKIRDRVVQYIGAATYLRHHEEFGLDRNKNSRRAIVFELAVDTTVAGVPQLSPTDPPLGPRALWKKPMQKLRDAAFASVTNGAVHSPRKGKSYPRSEVVKVYVLRRAAGFCEGCGNPSPFITRKGTAYLEPHHLRRRADDGPDHPLWVIALCPNCHARVHHGADGHEYNIQLADRVASLENSVPRAALLGPAV